jgi:uncharacterized MAPEG superfamily protein
VFIAVLLPLFSHAIKLIGRFQAGFDNHRPRDLENIPSWAQRAAWAEANSYEALPGFIAAVLISHMLGANPQTTGILGIVFLGARVLHTVFYVLDLASLRTLVWFIGLGCTIGIFAQSF